MCKKSLQCLRAGMQTVVRHPHSRKLFVQCTQGIYPSFISVPTSFLHNSHSSGYMHVRRHNSTRMTSMIQKHFCRHNISANELHTSVKEPYTSHPPKNPCQRALQSVKEPYNPSQSPTIRQRALHITSTKETYTSHPPKNPCQRSLTIRHV